LAALASSDKKMAQRREVVIDRLASDLNLKKAASNLQINLVGLKETTCYY
jgi:hypothetical protein